MRAVLNPNSLRHVLSVVPKFTLKLVVLVSVNLPVRLLYDTFAVPSDITFFFLVCRLSLHVLAICCLCYVARTLFHIIDLITSYSM